MRNLSLFLFLAFAGGAGAQSPAPQLPLSDPNSKTAFQMELMRRAMEESNDDRGKRAVAKREEQIAIHQFCAKANQFVALWMDFAYRLNEKQTFDAKLAKKLTKAFHELETSDGWPVREAAK